MQRYSRRDETRLIERATAEMFLTLYNAATGHFYRITDQPNPPQPDVCCDDAAGGILKLEITMLEDRPGDIQSLLGRSEAHSLERLKADNERIRRGEIEAIDTVAFFGRDASANLYDRLKSKLNKQHFGSDVALVMRGTSPLDWDWNLYMDDIREMLGDIVQELGLTQHPYDRGIWIVAREEAGPRLYMVAAERGGLNSPSLHGAMGRKYHPVKHQGT
jgi:hypothetical protein